MSFLKGWGMGEDIDRNRAAAAWADEKQARERGQWEREDQARTESRGYMDTAMRERIAAAGLDPSFLTQYGLEPQQAAPPQSGYGLRQGFAPPRNAAPMDGRVEAQRPAQAAQPAPVNPARQRGMTQMQLARTNDDYNGFMAAQKSVDDADTGSKYAQLHTAVMAAAPEKIAAFAKVYSDNANAPGKLTTGKNGLMTLTLDGGETVQMSRVQAASYVTGLYKMQQGDPTGLNDIAGVSDKLAAATDKMWGRLKDVGASNNDVVAKGNAMRNDDARTGIASAGLALRREEGNRTSPQNLKEFVDAKGNTVLLDVTGLPKDKEGRLGIPAGLRPKTARAEVTMKDVISLAEAYTGQPDPNAPKTAMSASRAMQVARQELGAGGSALSTSDAMLAGLPMEDPRKPAAAPAPKGGMTPPRQITTIVPPRSGADMRPRPVESDQEMFIRSMGY